MITPAPPAAAEAVAAASYFSTSPQQQEAREYYDEGRPPRAGEAQVSLDCDDSLRISLTPCTCVAHQAKDTCVVFTGMV